jgi:hypothetical protein
MMEVLVKKQVVVQRDQFTSFKLLEWVAEVLERLLLRKAGVVLMEGPAVERTEVITVIIADVEQAQTPLFLRDSDLVEMLFIDEVNRSRSGEDSESSTESDDDGSSDESFRDMDRDAMVE